MELDKYISKIKEEFKDKPNYEKFNNLLLMDHDFDFIKKIYPKDLKTFEDLIFKPHGLGEGVHAVLKFDNGQFASVVGGAKGLYGDGVETFELGYDDGYGNIDVIGWLNPDEITEEMFKLQIQEPFKISE
jgi:hypothetical protein